MNGRVESLLDLSDAALHFDVKVILCHAGYRKAVRGKKILYRVHLLGRRRKTRVELALVEPLVEVGRVLVIKLLNELTELILIL